MRRALLAPTLLVVTALLTGADWPEFRGPTGQGHAQADNLPLEWGPEKNVAWKVKVDPGWSSPVIVGGRIYLTTAVPDGKDLSLQAVCLDAATGKKAWDKEVFRQPASTARKHSKNSHATPTPVFHDGKLYVHFGPLGTACLDADGKVVWTQQVRYSPVHGAGGSPVIVDDLLVFNCDGGDTANVVALDRHKGTVRWKTARTSDPVKKFSFSTPLVIEVNGKKQIISAGSDMVGGYDPQTGKEVWRVRYTGYSVVPRPVFGHGLVYLSTSFDSPRVLAVRPDGKGDVTNTHVKWTTTKGVPHTPSLLLVGDELYMVSDNGTASCLDARTGEVHWQKRVGGTYSASPVHAAGRIYLQAEDGSSVVLRAGKEFERLARNELGERSLASPAVADGALFIRTASHLYRIQAPR